MKSAPFLSTLALAALAAAVPAAHAGILYSLSGDSQAIGGTFSLTFETPTFVSASTTLSDVPGLIGCTIFGVACESAQWLFEPRNHPLGADHTTFIIWAGSAGLSRERRAAGARWPAPAFGPAGGGDEDRQTVPTPRRGPRPESQRRLASLPAPEPAGPERGRAADVACCKLRCRALPVFRSGVIGRGASS